MGCYPASRVLVDDIIQIGPCKGPWRKSHWPAMRAC